MVLCLTGYNFPCHSDKPSEPNDQQKTGFPLTRKARFMLCKAGRNTRPAPYFTAPPSNHAAIFIRSSSVMCVTLPSGIAFKVTACW